MTPQAVRVASRSGSPVSSFCLIREDALAIARDPSFGLWARSMDFQFPNRKHQVVHTPEEAEALLRRLRTEVSPARSPI